VSDGVSGLASLISFKPDLVVLDFDLQMIDGFKVLAKIRSALNVPVVVVSGSRTRAIDRVMASELGADYYLTKPFSAKELKNTAHQLIARHRGITSWIMNPASTSLQQRAARSVEPRVASIESEGELFTPSEEFAAEFEKRVRAAIDDGAPFSIVGCRLPPMTVNGRRLALCLYDIVRELMRETDLTSANGLNDLVVLLPDANTTGARAFATRFQERVMKELNQRPALWIRSFPDLEESTEAAAAGITQGHGGTLNRRSSDRAEP
jgi:CheY-like chemotaxis protein